MSAGRILVIDDSEVILARVRTCLEAEGYEVVTTTQTVGTARHLPRTDLVIVDFHMPGIDGGAVLESLRSAAASSGAAPLFYLYTSDQEVAGQARRLGFDGVLTHKGAEQALVQQVAAAFRLIRMRALRRVGPPSR